MRLAYTSDLHVDLGGRNAALLEHVVARAAELAPDVLVIAGDLAETAAVVESSLQSFATVGGTKLYLAGNHDLYVEGAAALRAGEDSQAKFERVLPLAAARAGFGYLGLQPVKVGPVAIVGVPGWYDFSLRDPALDSAVHLEHYRAGAWRGVRAYDRGFVLWPRRGALPPPGAQPVEPLGDWAGDEEICDAMLQRLDRQLHEVGDARAIVAVIHVLPFATLVQRGTFGSSPFHDAYLGSTRLGERLQQEARVHAVISGHLHRVADSRVGRVRIVARPVGNARDPSISLEALAQERVGVLEIDA
jgi:Icc-related predicted phosphoesterase